jgi:hypothetical protein
MHAMLLPSAVSACLAAIANRDDFTPHAATTTTTTAGAARSNPVHAP